MNRSENKNNELIKYLETTFFFVISPFIQGFFTACGSFAIFYFWKKYRTK